MDCRVVVEAAVPVYDVETADEAVRIAISKTGAMLNPDLSYVEITMGERVCPHCHETLDPAFVAADESLVALELEMKVFNVEREEHASRIARKEIGGRLEDIPLEVQSVAVIESADEDVDAEDDAADAEDDAADAEGDVADAEDDVADAEGDSPDSARGDADSPAASDDARDTEPERESARDAAATPGDPASAEDDGESTDDDQVLPEFEDLID